MTQYINKADVVAEIKRRINEINLDTIEDWRYRLQREHDIEIMKNILSLIDTLEVKEVDLDRETTHYLLYKHHSPLNEIMHKTDLNSEMQYHKDVENAFKAGFELGLKTQKGYINKLWHDSNIEQPKKGSDVVVLKGRTGSVMTEVIKVYPDRIWAYINDLLNLDN